MRVQKLKTGSEQIIYQVWRCTTISNLMINEQIRDKEVRLIGPDGEQLGIMSAREAMAKAQEAELDLVKIAPQAKPPVCKIIDYGKYRYEDRVKVTLRFRGREMAHMSSSKHVLDDFADMLKDIAVVEKAPKVEGRSMTMFLAQKH